MRNAFFLIGLAILLLTVLHQAEAQNLNEVLDKHFKAVGQDKLLEKEVQSFDMTIEQMGMKIPMNMKLKRPDKFRMEMEVQGQKMITVYNGEQGWMIAPWIGQMPQELTGADLKQAMEQGNFDGELYNYAERGYDASLIGKVNIDGKPMFNVQLTGEDASVKNYYIDADDYLVKRIKSTIKNQGQSVDTEVQITEYKKIDGITVPARMETKNPMGNASIVFNEVTFDEKLEDSLFNKP